VPAEDGDKELNAPELVLLSSENSNTTPTTASEAFLNDANVLTLPVETKLIAPDCI
jgi:hypothetical protein